MKSLVTFLCIFTAMFAFFFQEVVAADITSPESLRIDTSIIREDTNYILPEKIIITPINLFQSDVNLTPQEHFRGLHYYTIEKLGYNDIPFHYVVGSDGSIFKGNEGGDERQISIKEGENNAILIAYLSEGLNSDFTSASSRALENLLTTIVNRNTINPNNIEVRQLEFFRDQETRSVSIVNGSLTGTWNTSLSTIKNSVASSYSPRAKTYGVELISTSAPEGQVTAGETITFSIELANVNPTGLYGGTDSELILSKTDSNPSAFFLNNEWLSQTEVPLMDIDEILLPLQSATFEVALRSPLAVGTISETFSIKTLSGETVSSDTVTLSINVARSDKEIIEILNTETGTLNVRSEPSTVASSFTQVSPGQRFFVLERDNTGYIRIDLGNGESGWVAGWYTRDI